MRDGDPGRPEPGIGPGRRRVPLFAVALALTLLVCAACGGSKSAAEQAADELQAGLAAHEQGDLAVAKEHYEAVLVLDPKNAYAYYNLGLIDQTNGDLSAAESNYRQTLEIDPNFVSAIYNLAIVRHDLGDVDEAIALYRQVIEIQPDHAAAHLNLGFALKEAGLDSEGQAELDIAVFLDPSMASRIPPSPSSSPSIEPGAEPATGSQGATGST